MLYDSGVRVPDIKAALAQLSQRCQVMLVRVPEEEIKRLTRRKPLQKLPHPNPVSTAFQCPENHSELKSSRDLKEATQTQTGNDTGFGSKFNGDNSLDYQSQNATQAFHQRSCEIRGSKRKSSTEIPSKKRRKKELFKDTVIADDTDIIASRNCNEVNKFLNTTVNVNYYNVYSTISSNLSSTKSSELKKNFEAANAVPKTNNESHNKLMIDVSLSDQNLLVIRSNPRASLEVNEGSREYGNETSRTLKSFSKHSKTKGPRKKRSKRERQKSVKPTLINGNNEEDPSIKELWSILGLESPIDRTAKFLSGQLNLGSSESFTLNSNTKETINQNPFDAPLLDSNDVTQVIDPQEVGTKDFTEPVNTTECQSTPEIDEPFIKISETFSLADMNTEVNETTSHGVVSPSELTIQENSSDSENGKVIELIEDGKNKTPCSIPMGAPFDVKCNINNETTSDTITESNHSNEELDQRNSVQKVKSKVGSIRVKNIGLLVDPQLQSADSETSSSTHKVVQSNEDVSKNTEVTRETISEEATEKSIEDRFYDIYKYYFDEFVETKIPKLGELLHLALADCMRLVERVKRADQLSSEDLIKEEKKRADKDFCDLMRLRGVEFTPLCDIIIKQFEASSKGSLFLSLFCRILNHAATIDVSNEHYVLPAKKVIKLMFERHQYKDKDILDILRTSDEDFEARLTTIRELIIQCVQRNNNNISTTSNKKDRVHISSSSLIISGKESQVTGNNGDYQTFRISEESYNRIQQIFTNPVRANNLNKMQSETINPPNGIQSKKTQDAFQKTNTIPTSGNYPNNTIANGTEQRNQAPQKTNLIPENTSVHRGATQMVEGVTNLGFTNSFQNAIVEQNPNRNSVIQVNSCISSAPSKQSDQLQKTRPPLQNQSALLKLHVAKLTNKSDPTNEENVINEQITSSSIKTYPSSLNNCSKSANPNLSSLLFTKFSSAPSVAPVSGGSVNVTKGAKSSSQVNNCPPPRPLQPATTSSQVNNRPPRPNRAANWSYLMNCPPSRPPQSTTSSPQYNNYRPRMLLQALTSSSTVINCPLSRPVQASTSSTQVINCPSSWPLQVAKSSSQVKSFSPSRPPQTATSPSQANNFPPSRPPHAATSLSSQVLNCPTPGILVGQRLPELTLTQAVSSAPLQYATSSVRNAYNRIPPEPILSVSTIPDRRNILINYIQKPNELNSKEPQQTKVNQVTSVAMSGVRNMGDHAIVRNESNQSLVTRPEENDISIRSAAVASSDKSVTPTSPTSSIGSPSSGVPASPEVTSPSAQVNLPSSSHCHPFIARRPISGKMKMLFENHSNH